MSKVNLVLIIHNVRSTHNVGSLLRTADGFDVQKIYLTGYTPYPKKESDERLPHLAEKIGKQIRKTALGAEKTISWEQTENIKPVLDKLKKEGYVIAALEQTESSQDLSKFKAPEKIALIVGNEVEGIDNQTLGLADIHLEIPMFGKKESFNVSIAGSIAMYHITALDN